MSTALSNVAFYEGRVTHRRQAPVTNRFRYRTFYWLIDTDHPPQLKWPLSWLGRFPATDHLDVRQYLAARGRPAYRILMLAHARSFGYVFNPISLYWCYGQDGSLTAVVAEVHNTYGGRTRYLLDRDSRGRSEVAKRLYVSPFYPVDGRYEITVSEPGSLITATVTLRRSDDQPFVATLVARRRPAGLAWLLGASLRYPWTPLRTSALIRWQGIRLWTKGLKVQPR
ncbi:MAG: DUF1365 domain-containing protein [Mycobacteriales bacterium]